MMGELFPGYICLVGCFHSVQGNIQPLRLDSEGDSHPAFELRGHMIIASGEEENTSLLVERNCRFLIISRAGIWC